MHDDAAAFLPLTRSRDAFWRWAERYADAHRDIDPIRVYEAIKGAWRASHDTGDTRDYDVAIRRIIDISGI